MTTPSAMRRAAAALLGGLLFAAAAFAQAPRAADDFPSRELRVMIGYPPGSASELSLRALAGKRCAPGPTNAAYPASCTATPA